MTNNALAIQTIKQRIHILTMRDPVVNQNIIRKLNRRVRKLESNV